MPRLHSQQRSRLGQSEMFNWKWLFTNFGWAMSMTDPMCYSYYLASRLDSTDGKGTPDVASSRMALRSLHGRDRARPAVLQMTSQETDSLCDSLPGAVSDASGRSVTRPRQTAEYASLAVASPDTSSQGRSISS
jgi:hypothetical protein